MDTIWEVCEDLWTRIKAILQQDWRPSPKGGQPPADWRLMFNGIIHRLRSGCQWNHLPKQFGSDRTIHRWFQRWCRNGVMAQIWAVLVDERDELAAVQWEWQSADGRLGKARFGGKKVGKNPTDRGKNGTKPSVLVDGAGGPLGAVVAAANVNDHLLLGQTIEAIVVERPRPTTRRPQHLCLDADYDNPASREVVAAHRYTPHICPAKKEQRGRWRRRGYRARRWVVERTLAWLSKCRGLLVRYDKHDVNYLGLLQLACGLLWYRRLHRLQAT